MNDPEEVPPAPPDRRPAEEKGGVSGAPGASGNRPPVLRSLSDEKELFLHPQPPLDMNSKTNKADGAKTIPQANLTLNGSPGESQRNKFADSFALGPVLGKGAYAPVHLAVHKATGKSVAVKIYEGFRQMEREKRALITREVQIMRKLQHENIVKYGGSFNESQALYIVMQHLSGGSLYGLVRSNPKGKLSEASARKLFLDVARGVAYLHSQSVVHRDLKLENMLLDDRGRVRLIDFGFASLLRPGVKCRMACGTPSYMPPEILKKKEYEGPAADMWSLGVVLYAMLHGCYPFKGQKPEELYANIAAGEYVVSQSLSTEVKALLQGLLFLNPEGRLKAEQVLSSPWLTAPADYGVGISPSHSRSDSSSSRTPKQHGGEGHPDPKAPNSTTRASSPAAQPTSQGPCPPSAAACCTQPQTSPLANKPKPQQDTLQPPDHNKQQQQPQQQSKNRQQHQPPSPQQQQQQEQQQQCGSQQPLPEPKPHSRFLSKVCEIFAPPASRTQRPLKP